ncbi:molybdate ABC transporter substrate-binding protein [Siculibacillus lacustris]|uniref:Molybdate ABC transporter substrate-binding protein n=1 Tax=Siculibacillus lacustris TaxID=1549641 RepID=A0A4V2KU71_9HYPH|nr:molybdate ABC transporter substrate-binding protein [Siculibacillus lacustris]TBW40315.1 molybdate ABC transporter substrate-binding protein [Siculibacillus lacustris]
MFAAAPLRRLAALALATGLALAVPTAPVAAETAGPTVFAAASMKTALDEIDALYTKATGKSVTVSYAASSALAKQIEQGAPADLFVSADIPWMDYVAAKGLIRPETRVDLLGNALVLIAPLSQPETLTLAPGAPLAAKIGDGKLATGDIASVPVGKYAKAALEKLGLWAEVQPKIAGTDNVRAALSLVARGEARYGIVYATDAKSEPKVTVVGTFPTDSHPPIVYPVAITKDSTSPDAAAYLAFLKGPEAAKIFVDQGFTILKP